MNDELKDLKKRAGITEAYDPSYHRLLDNIPESVGAIKAITRDADLGDWGNKRLEETLETLMKTAKELRRIHRDS